MTTDLRGLLETWRGRVQMPRNEYDSGRQVAYEQASEELQAALDAHAGMVCVGWEWLDTRDEFGWMRLKFGPDEVPPARPSIRYRRIYAGPVEGGGDGQPSP